MARPSHRLTIKDKEDGTTTEVGVVWPATRKDGTPITFQDGTQPGNIRLGNTSDKDAAEVYLVVIPKGGEKFKVSGDTHFISLIENRPKVEEDDDF